MCFAQTFLEITRVSHPFFCFCLNGYWITWNALLIKSLRHTPTCNGVF